MYIKFIEDNYKYKIINIENIRNNNIRVYFLEQELPINTNIGFNSYSDEDKLLNSYEEYTTIFNIGDNYIEYTDNSNIFYDYLVSDENGYIISITMRINQESEEEGLYLYRSGTTLEYMEWEFNIFDEYGYPLYKIVNGELIETSEKERNINKEKIMLTKLEQAKDKKIQEINSICSEKIVNGIIIDGERFSYTLEDQSNILTMLQIANVTNRNVSYHSDGNSYRLFSPSEINNIYMAQFKNLINHTTYSNQLKLYIRNKLFTIEEIEAIEYGQQLVDNYLINYELIIEQANTSAEVYIQNLKGLNNYGGND